MNIMPVHFNSSPNFKGITITKTTTQKEGNKNTTVQHNTYYPFLDESKKEIRRNFTQGITRSTEISLDTDSYIEVNNELGNRLPIKKSDYETLKAMTDLDDSEIFSIIS